MKLVFLFLVEKRLCSAAISFQSTQWGLRWGLFLSMVLLRAARSVLSQFPAHGRHGDGWGAERDAAWTRAREWKLWLLQLLMSVCRGAA